MSTVLHTMMHTPIGALRLFAEDDALVGIEFVGGAPETSPPADLSHPVLAQARRQLAEYFSGDRTGFELPLRARGTDFQERVWAALARIPYGGTRSYREIAAEIGRPEAVRAVGAANGRNPLPIVVPCHRVIGADGSLTGYGGGITTKTWLLRHERTVLDARGEPSRARWRARTSSSG
jgi:methylated-DNA-[protein]-cysteine S-methyltransferase